MMKNTRILLTVGSLLVPASLLACAGDPPPPPSAPVTPTSAITINRLPKDAPSPTASAIRISIDILRACVISDPDAYFAFDSAHVRPEDASSLDLVATCFTSGPLKGKTLKLVGHADPRGGSEYNMTLGQARADGVAGYVVSKGMEKSKTEATSRGEMDALGDNEPSWAHDRRVDLFLAR